MSTASEGLWIQSAFADRDILTDSRQFDGVIRTEDRNTRILVGFSNAVGSTLVLSSSGATLNGSMAASSLTVGGSNVLQEIDGLRTSVESVQRGGLSNGAVNSNAIADSNVPAQKIKGLLPTAVGGTGTGAGAFLGGRLAFGAADGGAERLLTDAALRFDQATSTLAAPRASALEVTLGPEGGARCRMTVDAGGELVLTALSAAGAPGPSLSLREVRALLQNIGVVPA